MAQFMNFFARQMVMGNGGASGVIYSDIFESSPVQSIVPELRVYTCSAAGSILTGTLQHTDDPNGTWTTYATEILQTGTGIHTGTGLTGAVPKRFMRGELKVPQGVYMMVHFNARGFC